MDKKVNILLLDDHELFAQGLKALFKGEDQFKFDFCLHPQQLFDKIEQTESDILLLDVNLDEKNGLELIPPIKEQFPNLYIIVLTSTNNVQLSTVAIKRGANAYLLKSFSKQELLKALEEVMCGNKVIAKSIADKKTANNVNDMNTEVLNQFLKAYNLTRREVDIISLIAQGYKNKNIAELFHISENTVKTHRKNIKRKLNFVGTADIVKFAFDTGILN